MKTSSVEQGWRRLLAKVIIRAIQDAKRGKGNFLAYDARDFLHSESCGELLSFFLGEFNPSMIDKILYTGERESSYKEVS